MGCSEGCLMSRSAGAFNQLVESLHNQDIKEKVDSGIGVYIMDRNSFMSGVREFFYKLFGSDQ